MRQDETSIGRYEITGELGRGSTGIVHRAHDPETDRDLAIKTFLWPNDIPKERRKEYQDDLNRQADAAGRLSHPGIVTIYEFDEGEEDRLPFIAMEYVPGPTLHELIRTEGALNPDWALTVAKKLASALQAASTAGVIHPDLKPANILVRESDGVAKITDFAMARLVDSTDPSEIRGTPAYLAPECIDGEPVDLRAQLYSLAAILHEMLCGEAPFTGETVEQIRHAIVHDPPVPITERVDDLADTFDAFFDRALAKDPADRYADIASFLDALESLRHHQRQFVPRPKPEAVETPNESVWDFSVPEELEPVPSPTDEPDLPADVPLPKPTVERSTFEEKVARIDAPESEHDRFAIAPVWKVTGIVAAILILLGAGWAWTHRNSTEGSIPGSEPGVSSPAATPGGAAQEETTTLLDWNRTPFAARETEFSAWDDLGVAEPDRTAETDGAKTTPTPKPKKAAKPKVVEPVADPVQEPEPVPVEEALPVETEPLPEPPAEPAYPVDVSYLNVLVKSSIKEGHLTLLVDGMEVYSADLSSDSKKFKRIFKKAVGKADENLDTRIEIVAGASTLTTRVFNAAKSKNYERTLRVDLEPGEERTLKIVAGRALGKSLTMKLD